MKFITMNRLMALGGLIALLLLVLAAPMPAAAQHQVWLTPMKMRADAEIPFSEDSVSVDKVIMFENTGNDSAIISLSASGIEVSFAENDFELGPGEEKTVHPSVEVEEGEHRGEIYVSIRSASEAEGTGAGVTTRWSIEVLTVGTKEPPPSGPPLALLIGGIVGGCAVAIAGGVLISRRKHRHA
jgi:hypothetical protein